MFSQWMRAMWPFFSEVFKVELIQNQIKTKKTTKKTSQKNPKPCPGEKSCFGFHPPGAASIKFCSMLSSASLSEPPM